MRFIAQIREVSDKGLTFHGPILSDEYNWSLEDVGSQEFNSQQLQHFNFFLTYRNLSKTLDIYTIQGHTKQPNNRSWHQYTKWPLYSGISKSVLLHQLPRTVIQPYHAHDSRRTYF